MTRIEFHHNVAHKLDYSCRLLRKVIARDLRALVLAEPELLAELDAALWSLSPTEFVPHCLVSAPEATRAASPIWLASQWPQGATHEVLLNLSPGVPDLLGPVQRHLEVVGREPADVEAGRARWRRYKQMGREVQAFNREND